MWYWTHPLPELSVAIFSANTIVLRLKSMSLFLWDHWGRIFEIFWVVPKSLGLTTDFKLLIPRARLNCADGVVVCVCPPELCFQDRQHATGNYLLWEHGYIGAFTSREAQIKGIISHLRVICLVEWPQLEFCRHILLPSMDGTEEVL